MLRLPHKQICMIAVGVLTIGVNTVFGQSTIYPKEIRGYKVERAAVELKQTKVKKPDSKVQTPSQASPSLIQFGNPRVVRLTPLGISLEIPIVVSPVRQKGRVDFLVFESITVNGTSVQIDEYHRRFNLPNKEPLALTEPLRFYAHLPTAVLGAIVELTNAKKEWPVTGTVYVFGHFNRSIFRFKRCIPVELNITIPNPLQKR
ncbi:MAG TPA: hypothetical protein VF074_08305 [Pyrinomonadaceae bacterium]